MTPHNYKTQLLSVVGLILVSYTALALLDTGSEQHPPSPNDPISETQEGSDDPHLRAKRTFDLMAINPTLTRTRIDALLTESDQIRAAAEEMGEEDLGQALRSRLNEIEISETSARAFFEQERELFGSRSFEQSRWTIERLLAIQQTRTEFGLSR